MLLNNHNYCEYFNRFFIKIYDCCFTKKNPPSMPLNKTTNYHTIPDDSDSSSQCSSDEDYFVVNYQDSTSISSDDNY